MRGDCPKTTLCDDGIPPKLRPFIDVLLNGDRQGPSKIAPPICPKNVDKGESRIQEWRASHGKSRQMRLDQARRWPSTEQSARHGARGITGGADELGPVA